MRQIYLTSVFVLGACTLPVAALAQEALEQSVTKPERHGLDTITVTAQRTEQDIKDVPISILALDGDMLESRGIDDFEQLQFIAPGTSFNSGVNARQSGSVIRGIGTSLFNLGVEGSVAIAIDGVIIGREGAGILDFSDVERIEVLRGPQGTLFGKNASAGVISIITKNPTEEFSAKANIAYGSYDEVNLSAALSGPIAPGVTARVNAYSNTRNGYINNINPNAPQRRLNDRDEFGFRGKLNFDISENINLLLSADYVSRDQATTAFTLRSASAGGLGQGLLGFGIPAIGQFSALAGIIPGPDNLEIASDGRFQTDMEVYGGAAEASIRIGKFDLVSLSSWRQWDSFDINDADLIPQSFLFNNDSDLSQKQFSQELRLVSPQDARLRYILGAYYFHQKINETAMQVGTGGLDLLGQLPPGFRLGTELNVQFDENNIAAFGQGEFDVTQKLTLIAGFRLLNSDLSTSQSRGPVAGTVGPFVGQNFTLDPATFAITPFTVNDKDTASVWRFGLKYKLDSKTNIFTTLTRGYKAVGLVTGFNTDATEIGGTTLPITQPEIPTQFELGTRSSLWDGRINLGLTGFYTEVDDFQAEAQIIGPSGTRINTVSNAEKVRTYGLEGEITVLPVENVLLSTAFAYTKANFKRFESAPCYALQPVGNDNCIDADGDFIGDFQSLSGDPLANSPDWVVNSLARYDFDISQNVGAYIQSGVQYRSATLFSNTGDPNTRLKSYALVDAQIGLTFWDDQAEFVVFGRNLTKENFAAAIFNAPFDTGGFGQFRSIESLRTFGARLNLAL